jgi:hypothetical protein
VSYLQHWWLRNALLSEKRVSFAGLSFTIFLGKDGITLTLLRKIIDNISVIAEFGFHPEISFELSLASLYCRTCDAD